MKPDQTPGANQDAGGIPVYPESTTRPPRTEAGKRLMAGFERPEWHERREDVRRAVAAIEDEAAAPDAGLREALERLLGHYSGERQSWEWEATLRIARAALAAHPAPAPHFHGYFDKEGCTEDHGSAPALVTEHVDCVLTYPHKGPCTTGDAE